MQINAQSQTHRSTNVIVHVRKMESKVIEENNICPHDLVCMVQNVAGDQSDFRCNALSHTNLQYGT